jgi:phytanoyl-CoA hydroxylase
MSDKEGISVRISLDHDYLKSIDSSVPIVPDEVRQAYQKDGFIVLPEALSLDDVNALNDRLEKVLRGEYDREQTPDKAPRLLKSTYETGQFSGPPTEKRKQGAAKGPLGFSGNLSNVKVLQLINVNKCDRLFRALVTSPVLGKIVAELAGWEATRLGQDQVWAKPPGAPPLVFHRDSPYFMFTDPSVVTAWIALDDMDEELGPLQYVRGSHLWGEGRVGTSKQFYQHTGGMKLMLSAASVEGLTMEDLEIVSMAGLKAGGITIHNGRTWHGSGKNASESRPRRGVGIHFVPAHVMFNDEAQFSKLWRKYWETGNMEPCEEDFPITWRPI